MKFLRKVKSTTMFDKYRNTCESLDIEPLLPRIEISQLRWFDLVSRMLHERLPKQTLHTKLSEERPVGRPQTRWLDYIEELGWNRMELYLS